MKHTIALVTGGTSGLGYAAARTLAGEGWREIIVSGRSLARVQETLAQLAAETKTQVFTPLELELDTPSSVQSALAELVKLGKPIDFLLLNAGLVPFKKRVLTAAGVEASQAPLIGHHQLTVGLLRATQEDSSIARPRAGAHQCPSPRPALWHSDLSRRDDELLGAPDRHRSWAVCCWSWEEPWSRFRDLNSRPAVYETDAE
jgi:NAD(P)-dependent dehydrogenase (short-subunit alcohol dehydrogenase family)